MLKDYLKEKKISMYKISTEIGIPYSTLNDLANCRIDIDNCKVIHIKKLSEYLNLTMEELYRISKECWEVDTRYEADIEKSIRNAKVYVKGKMFNTSFIYNDKPVNIEICAVKEGISDYISEMARWEIEDYVNDLEWEKLNEILVDEKK